MEPTNLYPSPRKSFTENSISLAGLVSLSESSEKKLKLWGIRFHLKVLFQLDLQKKICDRIMGDPKIFFLTREIRDQIFDEKKNTVTITVVCCSPEKIKQKICCKGGETVKDIQIVEPTKPKPPEKPKKKQDKPKEPDLIPEMPIKPQKEPEEPAEKPEKPKRPKEPPAPEPAPTPLPIPILVPVPAPKSKSVPVSEPAPAHYPPPPPATCCNECWEGIPGGPCYYGGGPEQPYYDPCSIYGKPVYENWSGGYYTNRCDYINEGNPSACTIV
ncbi:uncharacterized protein [Rutidosis leptorrhynchoides]|uniref:uncharacterized protein n=1 Tax=Rutidosis leptorrhynchoides TaxID=125765 RepID=UPI003A99F6D1